MSAPVTVATENAELHSVRDAMRELNRIVAKLEVGELEKAVLTKGGKMVAAVVPLDHVSVAYGEEAVERMARAMHAWQRSGQSNDQFIEWDWDDVYMEGPRALFIERARAAMAGLRGEDPTA